MKKTFFMILMAFFLACFMPAQETGGDGGGGDKQEAFALTAVLSGNGAEIRAVVPDSAGVYFILERQNFVGVSYIAERFAVINKYHEKVDFDFTRAVSKTSLNKEALTLRGA
jgi:hypothetical protein